METNKRFKILAVDDNPKNIQVIGSVLRKANYSVGFATDGQQALEILEASPYYDLIMLDVNMPRLNGYDTCKAIRKNPKTMEIPIIFLTAHNDSESIVTGFKAGGHDYISKPFNTEELLARVSTHIELKYSRDKLKEVNKWLEEKVLERTKDLNEANLMLQKANKELNTLDEAKTDFLRIISHEINTPLNGIIGFATLLKTQLQDSDLFNWIHYLEISAARLERFSKTSILLTELRTTKRALNTSAINIADIIAIAQKNLNEAIADKAINLHITIPSTEPVVTGNELLLQTCFESILDNAIKYSEAGSHVEIKVSKTNTSTLCEFIDNGKGFSEKALENKFKLFAPGADPVDKDSGLQLALAKLIMTAHDGEIDIKNNHTKGSTVTLVFPFA
ncbi:MAG: hybrid sensor histidine kinase/response regulator [Bacteroidales bacterium]|nr:hybrid sensor histidine kinase/response regulator [Bacteroidales bacterium]MBN2749704.1 hybrid sensor histidine kinase/response regulator [Bacteroidales bacterium]